MSGVRNLTNNSQQNLIGSSGGGESELSFFDRDHLRHHDQSENPFLGSDEERDDDEVRYHHNNNSEASLVHDIPNFERSNQDLSDYKGYYSKNSSGQVRETTKNLTLPKRLPQSESMASGLSTNDIMSPPEYDRYPLVGSRVASMAQLHQAAEGRGPSGASGAAASASADSPPVNGSSSSLSSNPFLVEHDFSPFGGYPASSFPLLMEEKEDDDYLHNPDPEEEARLDRKRFVNDFKHMSWKSFGGMAGLLLLLLGGAVVFVVIPAVTFTGATHHGKYHQVITFLTDYQYPQLSAIRTNLVDKDTPAKYKTKKAKDGSLWKLVFSDEFNAEGRTFYDDEDQFWTAVNLNYDATHDLEWYDPDAATTKEGTLQLRMDAYKNHNLYYRSAMLQSWNKLCFTQGRIEASVNLPNYGRVTGLWPGMWTMGNLGRPGYLASTEGVWPYSYEECDAGITPNQSSPDGISYLPGQRLNACTCDGEDHPNQGTGRGAPEIDMIEGETDTYLGTGIASQSLQVAPFDIWYIPDYDYVEIYNFTTTSMNTYCGGPFQQAVSAITTLHPDWYEFGPTSGKYQTYGYELLNDDENGYIQWFVGDRPTMALYAKALHPNGNIGWRRLSKEPLSIILNLGISNNWAYIDWEMILFPVTMSIDYVRIYQPNNSVSVTCDPEDYPTAEYIAAHKNVYLDANLSSWEDAGYTFPKNILTGNCKSSKYSKKTNSTTS
ncbi:probable Beta-glucan synthesis-associated protein KRE6 [Zygosaccharomyces bailii]|nr:probable Beta-glucan synthesis-associated protein KRE6 [Zygosaccharomyces bailii]